MGNSFHNIRYAFQKIILKNMEETVARSTANLKRFLKDLKKKKKYECMQSLIELQNSRQTTKKLKTAVEFDEKREMTKETKWNRGGNESGKKLKKEGGGEGRSLTCLINKKIRVESVHYKGERLEMIQLRESRNFRSNDIASR